MSNTYRIAFNEITWQTAPSGVRFKVYKEGTQQLRLLEFGRDLNHPDWCVTGHIGFVIEGEMEIEFDDEVITYQTGDGIVIPAGEKHRHRPKAVSEKVKIVFVEEIK
jgi:quercetin dioxygenase-like cupin family protein